jgi:3'-phosphoadenosine 5'-phosphosulfate sulfotransferase (PAPS reductase)/FAD synthetase
MTPIQRAAYLAHWRTDAMQRRVSEARIVLERASAIGRLSVSMSWGKDSVVAGHLALQYLPPPVTMMHIASSYRLPGFERVQSYFEARAGLHIIEPRRTLQETIEWLREVGLPHERTAAQQRAVVKAIKKDIGIAWCIEHGYGVQVMGIRADESKGRDLRRTRYQVCLPAGLVDCKGRVVVYRRPRPAVSPALRLRDTRTDARDAAQHRVAIHRRG